MTNLFAYLDSLYPLPKELDEVLQQAFRKRTIAKKEYLLWAGKPCQHLYFVEKGLLHVFYCLEEKDISSSFIKEGEVAIPVGSFFGQKRGHENIQAMEESVVLCIDYNQWEQLLHQFPVLNYVARRLLEKCLAMHLQRFQGMWTQLADRRYKWLKEQYPWLFQRVPAKYLASYLGITPAMLSRVKAKR